MLRRILCFLGALLITILIFFLFVELPSRTAQPSVGEQDLHMLNSQNPPPFIEQDIWKVLGVM